MFELFKWSVTSLAIFGVVLNIRKSRWCFAVWIVTNTSWAVVDIIHEVYSQAFLMLVYLVLSVWGWFHWKEGK